MVYCLTVRLCANLQLFVVPEYGKLLVDEKINLSRSDDPQRFNGFFPHTTRTHMYSTSPAEKQHKKQRCFLYTGICLSLETGNQKVTNQETNYEWDGFL